MGLFKFIDVRVEEDVEDGTMHEIFLTTSIGDEYCAKATRILQGYCGMSPTPILRRRLILKGPSNRGDYRSIQPQFMLNQQQKTRLWQSLNEQLTRQGYCIALLYDIKKDDFPKVGEELEVEEKRVLDCNTIPGTLQWYELPDPGVKAVNSRPAIFIDGERNLCNLFQSINYRFNNEFIEEGYRFIHGNVVISLTRYLTIPAEAQEMGQDGRPLPNKNLPPYESLNLLDGDNTWVMVAKMDISNGNDPELMQRGTAELLAIQAELEGLFHLQPRDRLIFETRIRATNG